MNNDVVAILFEIKENIKKVESNIDVKESLNNIESLFFDFSELVKLFLISERDSYYGYFLLNMQFKVNFCCKSIAGIRLNSLPPVFETNPLLLCKLSLKEILYVFCHEIDHVMLNHPYEMVKANPTKSPDIFEKFNIAADASINDRIDNEIVNEKHNFLSRPNGVITSDSISRIYGIQDVLPLENYQYYFDLIKDIKKDGTENISNGQESIMDNISHDDGGNEELQYDEGIVTSKNYNGNLEDHNWDAGDYPSDVEAITKEFLNKVNDTMDEETRGLMPGVYTSSIERINREPVISWQSVLKKYVGTISASKIKTRARLNRRQPERFDLSGTKEDKILKIVVAIDTSGSMSNKMLSEVVNEIFSILAKRKYEITIIECDTRINRVYKVKSPKDIKLEMLGRGGTSFIPVIEYINDNKYYRDALLIYFTDGFGDLEIPKPMTYRNIWVVNRNIDNLSVREPYGIVLKL